LSKARKSSTTKKLKDNTVESLKQFASDPPLNHKLGHQRNENKQSEEEEKATFFLPKIIKHNVTPQRINTNPINWESRAVWRRSPIFTKNYQE